MISVRFRVRADARPGMTTLCQPRRLTSAITIAQNFQYGDFGLFTGATPTRRAPVSIRAVINAFYVAAGNRLGGAHGFIDRLRSPLLLQSRIISRRRRDGRRRGTGRRHRYPTAESRNSGDGTACIKSLHGIPPGAVSADARVTTDVKFALHRRHFKDTYT